MTNAMSIAVLEGYKLLIKKQNNNKFNATSLTIETKNSQQLHRYVFILSGFLWRIFTTTQNILDIFASQQNSNLYNYSTCYLGVYISLNKLPSMLFLSVLSVFV